jgi:localization factor PodJL
MAPAAASSTQAAKTYVAELPPSDGIDPFSDLLSDLDRDDAHTEARESDVFDTFAEAPTPEERPSARGQSTAQAASADYISRARQAAIAASIDGRTNVRRKTPSARKASVRPRPAGSKTKSKAPLYAAGAAVVMAGTAAAAYVYLRGKQEAPEFATSQPVFSIPEAGMARAAPETEAPATELTAEETAALEAALFEAGDDAANSSLAPVPAPAIEGLSVATTAVAKAAAEPVEKAATQAAVSQPAVKTATTPVDASPASQDAPYAPILPVVTVEAAANGGNQFAQYQFAEDRLAAGDFTTGAAMMKKAAQKGLPSAEYRLAKLHERGMGVPKDLTLARQWTEKAAKGGNVKAMYDLAVFMAQGEGGAQSYSGAAEWFRKGAEYGLVDSQYNLGLLYEQGLGISPSLSDALFWYEVAAAKGDKDAIAKAKDLRSRLSAESQAQVTARATSWTPSRDVAVANGRFGAQPWNTGNPLQVQGVQNALNALGFKAGAADGVLTPMTAKAIRDYQGANKLDVTGTVTGALVDSLNARLTTATPKN